MQITDRTFVVTGGGNGIGREVVLALLARGARVAALDLDEAGLQQTRARAGSAAIRLTQHAVDITDRNAVDALPELIAAEHGAVDGLLNVAGIIQPFVTTVDLDHGAIERVIAVNLWGVIHTVKAFLPGLLERSEACLVNVASMSALTPVPGQAAYGASKAAVKLFSEALFAELQGTAVAVTTVFPGAIATGITANSGVTMPAMAAPRGRAPKPTSPQQAARAILDGIERGSYRVLIGKDVTALDRLARLAPRRATLLLARQMRSLLA